jgi:CheY-like chemotaxis protein
MEDVLAVKKGKGTVLVIDDEPVLRELSRSMLGQAGYDVIIASDGTEGIAIYKKNQDAVDIVLLDMIMPGIDGRETFIELKKIDSGVKVIMTSGFSKDKRVEDVLAEGAKDFIQKPYTIYDLTDKVYGILYDED